MAWTDDQHNLEARSPSRPGSAWTSESLFADSAISLRSDTPKPFGTGPNLPEAYEQVDRVAIRLNGLVSEIWAIEQDGTLGPNKRRKIEIAVNQIEAALLDDDTPFREDDMGDVIAPKSEPSAPQLDVQKELDSVRASLAMTVESMRMRQQEQRHLHQLTIEKLEAVAQRCIQQEKRLLEFSDEIVRLKEKNQLLASENDMLNVELDESRAESQKRDIAVNAMSSAVAGLEGWINHTQTPAPDPRKVVIRGRGRFRGRYYVDGPSESELDQDTDGGSDVKTLHEGVNAWLRGFNDIEQELRSTSVGAENPPKWVHSRHQQQEADEWGDFESASVA